MLLTAPTADVVVVAAVVTSVSSSPSLCSQLLLTLLHIFAACCCHFRFQLIHLFAVAVAFLVILVVVALIEILLP